MNAYEKKFDFVCGREVDWCVEIGWGILVLFTFECG